MVYAPILIPTLCRYEHFVKCIESLKKNTWAKYTDVYIGLDYPSKDSHWDGYNKICEYLQGDFSEFASFNVIKRTENYGSGRNMREMRADILQRYDRFIRTDDDIEFSQNFLEYMDKCLEHYENDDSVIAVSGYSYPVNWKVSEGSNVFLENFVVPMWGTGFWTDKFLKIRSQLSEEKVLVKRFPNIKKYRRNMTDACYLDYVNDYLSMKPYWLDSISDIAMRIYCAVEGGSVVCPVVSKSRNLGFDGSGVYCQTIDSTLNGDDANTYSYANQKIDEDALFEIHVDTENAVDENRTRMNLFDGRPAKAVKKASAKLMIYKFLGKKLYSQLLKRKNKVK